MPRQKIKKLNVGISKFVGGRNTNTYHSDISRDPKNSTYTLRYNRTFRECSAYLYLRMHKRYIRFCDVYTVHIHVVFTYFIQKTKY